MSLYGRLAPRGPNGLGYGSTAEEVTAGLDLHGKTFLVTGCNSGLGLETTRVLRLRGGHVVGTARSESKANEAGAQTGPHGTFTGLACELADPASVRGAVRAMQERGLRFDAVIANAGIMALPRLEKAHGIELQFFTNHVGHFLLVTGILGLLHDEARVVMLSSRAHRNAPKEGIQFDNLSGDRGYSAWGNYGQSKLANLLFAKGLQKRFAGTKRTANAVHPGVIHTNLGRNMEHPLKRLVIGLGEALAFKTIPQGAATQCYVAVHPAAAGIGGAYFSDCQVARPRRDAEDPELAERLWTKTEELVAGLP
jgi:NAD(P)-dependent dehydrogenase (short-subunit alcohol dehydrogenase family)